MINWYDRSGKFLNNCLAVVWWSSSIQYPYRFHLDAATPYPLPLDISHTRESKNDIYCRYHQSFFLRAFLKGGSPRCFSLAGTALGLVDCGFSPFLISIFKPPQKKQRSGTLLYLWTSLLGNQLGLCMCQCLETAVPKVMNRWYDKD